MKIALWPQLPRLSFLTEPQAVTKEPQSTKLALDDNKLRICPRLLHRPTQACFLVFSSRLLSRIYECNVSKRPYIELTVSKNQNCDNEKYPINFHYQCVIRFSSNWFPQFGLLKLVFSNWPSQIGLQEKYPIIFFNQFSLRGKGSYDLRKS